MTFLYKALTVSLVSLVLTSCLPTLEESPDKQTSTESSTESVDVYTLDQIGVPGGYDQRLDYSSFSVGYNYSRKHADWVGAALLPELVRQYQTRVDSFREENQIPAQYRATLEDYRNSGYDRGHLASNATHDQTTQSMYDTFTLANISPQIAEFNRGDWAQLEDYVRDCVATFPDGTPLFVFTGPYYGNLIESIGSSNIPVPVGYYKVIFEFHGDEYQAMGIKAPQQSFDFDRLENHIVSVDTIELLTGLDFATIIPESTEQLIEKTATAACPIPSSAPSGNSSTYSECGTKRYCSQMNSCDEARYFLNSCNVSSLDGDSDGTPCEAICN